MKSYEMHDNGGRPFVAYVVDNTITIYRQKYIDQYQEHYQVPDKKILETTFIRLFLGDNNLQFSRYPDKGKYPGNTILIQVDATTFIFVGHAIYTFHISDDIIESYYSPVGNSDVPYPYAIGKQYSYFMLDRMKVSNEHLQVDQDGYLQFYQLQEDIKQPIAYRTIAKRVW
jgi:hypothetical protein